MQSKTMKGAVDKIQTKSRIQSSSNRGRPAFRQGNATRQRDKAPSRPESNRDRPQTKGASGRDSHKYTRYSNATVQCKSCGYDHSLQDRCPAKGKQCTKCKKYNHFAKVCKSIHSVNVNDDMLYMHDEESVDSSSSDEFVIDSI